MTSRTLNRDQFLLRSGDQARFEVEVLLQAQLETADVDVVIKRRRITSTDHRADGNDDSEVVEREVRTPRIFKVEKQPRQESPKGASEAETNGESRLGVAVSSLTQVRRRRRRLNGEVTIVRPLSHQPKPVLDEQTRAKPDSQPQSAGRGRFGVDAEEQGRHEKLLGRIELLKRQAQKARTTEAATAIRWIKKAINEYCLDASELGF